MKLSSLCALLLLAISLPTPAWAKKPNIILISVDTLGAGHMSLYGYHRRTTPAMDAFAKEGVTFQSHMAQAAYTLASHYSIFTGTFPQTHKVMVTFDEKKLAELSDSIKTLPELLKKNGYRTYWLANLRAFQLDLTRGLGRGLDEKINVRLDNLEKYPARWNAVERAFKRAKDEPSFFFFHTNFVHDPYQPDPAYEKEYAGKFKKKKIQSAREVLSEDKEGNNYLSQFDINKPEEREHLKALYDGGIRSFDDRFQHFLGLLKKYGIYENSIIILTADHGEVFGERGYPRHEHPYRDELHTPLVIRGPGIMPGLVSQLSMGADILPTVLDLVGAPPASGVDGQTLVPLMKGKEIARAKYHLMSGYRSEAIADEEWKLIVKEDGSPELYRTSQDPKETRNLSSEHPAEANRLEAALESFTLSRRGNLKYQDPLKRNKKLYWFIPDGMRADRGDFNIFKWAREGKLPNIKRMMDEGTYGYSIPYFPSHTPINFASLLTGSPPSTHGISDGPMHVEGAPLAKPSAAGFSSTARKVPAIWQSLEEAGKKVFLLSVPGSTPPEIRGTTVRGRWGGWGVDTFNLVFESKGLLPKRREMGRAFRLFFLGEPLTKFVETKQSSDQMLASRLEAYGLAIELKSPARGGKAKAFTFGLNSKEISLKQGQWSEWLPVELEVKGVRFPSNVKFQVIKSWADGNFRIRVLYNNLNRLIAEPGIAADQLTASTGPMVDHLDNWPPQLIFEPEDRQTALDEIDMSLNWHKRAVSRIMLDSQPDAFIHDTYTPNQMLESRWWQAALDPKSKGANPQKRKRAQKEVLQMYQKLDAILGEAIANTDASTVIALSSDHGVCPLHTLVHLNNLFAKKGWLKFTQHPETGEVTIDWKNTKVVYLKMLHVYINPNGLEGDWKRSSGSEYEKLREEVIKAIAEIKDENGIRPLVKAVKWEAADNTYDLPLDRIGDLILEAKLKYFWYEEADPSLKLFSRPKTAGYKQAIDPNANECVWAPFLIYGGGVKKGFELPKPIRHADQMPTLLKLLDIPTPAFVKGKVLTDALE